ncbi:hypothetical protein FOA52_011741 [Chlamydomonas sp. UWO 241]|nr:hypothetical protein FOA52_011741 [Chlamydomonas sp. UWO 241]
MRELHPDRGGLSGAAESNTELCALLNEIYEVLGDEGMRASYDSMAGFSACSTNPFVDASSFERDQLFVDEVSCIGCGKCAFHSPRTFEIEESKYGRARVIDQSADCVSRQQIAIEVCPVDCIHWVTLPQLSLLEAALAGMGRVEVFIMQRSNSRPIGNVFQEANRAWERRQEAIAEAAARPRPKVDWAFWGSGSLEREEREEAERSSARDPVQARIAKIAVAAAKGALVWRAYLRSRTVLRALSDGGSSDGQP